jgi:hypothetical protein
MGEFNLSDRVIYIGSERRLKRRWLGWLGMYEPEREWRQRLAQEMETACQEMSRRGLRLVGVIPVLNAQSMKGSWTEGAWLYFNQPALVESEPRVRDRQFAI